MPRRTVLRLALPHVRHNRQPVQSLKRVPGAAATACTTTDPSGSTPTAVSSCSRVLMLLLVLLVVVLLLLRRRVQLRRVGLQVVGGQAQQLPLQGVELVQRPPVHHPPGNARVARCYHR